MSSEQIELASDAIAEFKGLVCCLCEGGSVEAEMAMYGTMPKPSDVPDWKEVLQNESGWRTYALMVAESAAKLLKERIGR